MSFCKECYLIRDVEDVLTKLGDVEMHGRPHVINDIMQSLHRIYENAYANSRPQNKD